jgi:hypothetical protein
MIFRYLSILNRGSECPLQGFTFRRSLQETPAAFDNMTFVANPTLRRTADTLAPFTLQTFKTTTFSLLASRIRTAAWCCPSNMCVSQVIAHGKNFHSLKANKLYLSMTASHLSISRAVHFAITSSVGHFAGSSASEAGRRGRALSAVWRFRP